MDLRAKIEAAVYEHPRADDQINAVMGVVEAEQRHARADSLFWAARQLRDTPVTCTALTGPYWYGQGWKEAADHLMDLAEWDPSDGEAERTQLAARVRELEEENRRLRDTAAVTRYVADHWREAAVTNGRKVAAHPLCLVLAALGGESDPEQLGLAEEDRAALGWARDIAGQET